MKKLLSFLALTGLFISSLCAANGVRAMLYPAMIYDDGRTSFYSDAPTLLTFCFYYEDQRVTDIADTTKLFVEVPEKLVLSEVGIMDRWKADNSFYKVFASEKVIRDGVPYIRYQVPLIKNAFQPTIKQPLPGGMFGGTPNNVVNMTFQPQNGLAQNFKLYWTMEGKYAQKGEVPCYLVTLPAQAPKLRTELRAETWSPVFAISPDLLKSQAELYHRIGIVCINSLSPDVKKLFDPYGFRYFGGGSMMHVLNGDGRGRVCSDNMEDYLVGLDGKRSYGVSASAHRLRLFCPHAAIQPGRYPNNIYLEKLAFKKAQGVADLDIDIEAHIWAHCFCPACRAEFHKFSGTKNEGLTPVELLNKYPLEWYRFRSEQTRRIYAMLKKNAPEIRIGANTLMGDFEGDLADDLKWGVCSFAEDPRLMKGTLEYILADTLIGGIMGGISVEFMKKGVDIPIIAVSGASYCVGFSWGDMPARRLTAEMTGDTYGYECRPQYQVLDMIFLAACGASGVRVDVKSEPVIACSVVKGAQVLAKVEDFYLDGKKDDGCLEVSDLTKEWSPWLQDKSRIRGGVWRHYYDQYNGRVQYRVHRKDGETLVSLFNWDPMQKKTWHVRTRGELSGYLSDVDGAILLKNGTNEIWSADDLKKGFSIDVPAFGFRLLKLSPKKPATTGELMLHAEATDVTPYNQYCWRTGEKINLEAIMKREVAGALKCLEKFGNVKETTRPAAASKTAFLAIPFKAEFGKDQSGVSFNGEVKHGMWISTKEYGFLDLRLAKSDKPLKVTVTVKGTPETSLGVTLYEQAQNGTVGKRLLPLEWLKSLPADFTELNWILPADKLQGTTRLIFYNCGRKDGITIKALTIEENKQ